MSLSNTHIVPACCSYHALVRKRLFWTVQIKWACHTYTSSSHGVRITPEEAEKNGENAEYSVKTRGWLLRTRKGLNLTSLNNKQPRLFWTVHISWRWTTRDTSNCRLFTFWRTLSSDGGLDAGHLVQPPLTAVLSQSIVIPPARAGRITQSVCATDCSSPSSHYGTTGSMPLRLSFPRLLVRARSDCTIKQYRYYPAQCHWGYPAQGY